MATSSRFRITRDLGAYAFVGVSACIGLWTILPEGVVVLNDDFGYLRSVLETAARGRPWTDDWLEPWAASLSAISALIFKSSGSFRLATHGLQCVLWGIFVAAVFHNLRGRLVSRWHAALLSLAICYTPVLFWKGVEFTGLVLYLPCLALAVGAASGNRWGIFAIVACLALATRQSAVAWFVIPGVACAETMLTTEPGRWRRAITPLLACVAGVVTFLVCRWGMNETHAQRMAADQTWDSITPSAVVRSCEFALLLSLLCLGAANGLKWLLGTTAVAARQSRAATVVLRLLPIVAIVTLLCLRRYADVQKEHEFYGSAAARFSFASWIAVGCLGWLIAPLGISPRLLGAACAAALLASLRPVTWDYYWIDAAFLAFFAAFRPDAATEDGNSPEQANRTSRGFVATAVILVLILPTVSWIDRAKRVLDDCRAKEVVLEQSLRAGEISPADLAVSPFGFMAWHLYPYFITTEAGATDYIANFQNHLRPENLAWETRSANDRAPITDPGSVVRTSVFASGWRGERNEYILRRRSEPAPAPVPIAADNYRFEAFPLNDAEWRNWRMLTPRPTSGGGPLSRP